MDLFYEYDIERLRSYDRVAANAGKITIESCPSHLLLSYTDVGYFNYCVCHQPANLPEVVEQVKPFYIHRQVKHHKLLIDEALGNEHHFRFLNENGYTLKERLMAVRDPTLKYRQQPHQAGLRLESVSEATLSEFTENYLAAFESEQKNSTPVVNNFRQLTGNKNIALFQVVDQREPVGIAVFYGIEKDFCLAGGAILPAFRNKGYHKTALVTRLNWLNEQNARSIISWAYANGISYQNMLKVGLVPYKSYRVYER